MIKETDWDTIMQIQSHAYASYFHEDSAPFWQQYGFSCLEHISVCPSYGQAQS